MPVKPKTHNSIPRHREVRLAFWRKWLSPDSPFAKNRDERLKQNRPLPPWAVAALPAGVKKARILDVNAGPASALGTMAMDREIELVPVDELADHFDALLEEFSIKPPVRTQYCAPDDILLSFGRKAFQLIYSSNGLGLGRNPIEIYRVLLDCLADDGSIITFHEKAPDHKQRNLTGDRYYHDFADGRPIIRNRGYAWDLQDFLPDCVVNGSCDGRFVRVELSARHEETHPLPVPQPIAKTGELPAMISMHLPKTAGTSFRVFLEKLYGSSFKGMYTKEETHPKYLDKIPVKLPAGTRCLHGHFRADAYDAHLPGAVKVTWLRDPVERAISNYFQIRRNPGINKGDDFHLNKRLFGEAWGLLEFAQQEDITTQTAWFLNKVPLDDFIFIGITEWFDPSIRLLCHLLNLDIPEESIQVNENPMRQKAAGYNLTDEQRKELEVLFANEIQLYRNACHRLRNQYYQAFGSWLPDLENR